MKIINTLILLCFISTAHAHESNREAQLKATNDELTLRVAELLKENERLEAFAKEALIAKSNNKKIVEGCDTKDLRREIVSTAGYASTARYWLDRHGDKCNEEQLEFLIENLDSWSSYTMAGPIRYIRFLLDN